MPLHKFNFVNDTFYDFYESIKSELEYHDDIYDDLLKYYVNQLNYKGYGSYRLFEYNDFLYPNFIELGNKYQYYGEKNEEKEKKVKYWYDRKFNPKQLIEIFLDATKIVGYETIKNGMLSVIFENVFELDYQLSDKKLKNKLDEYKKYLTPESHQQFKEYEIFKNPSADEVEEYVKMK